MQTPAPITVSSLKKQGALLVFTAAGSVGIVQFFKSDYYGTTPWKYRNAIDSKWATWTDWQTIATTADIKKTATRRFASYTTFKNIANDAADTDKILDTAETAALDNQNSAKEVFEDSAIETSSNLENESRDVLLHNIVDTVYPIGSIYINASGVKPEQFFPNTKWELACPGQLLACIDTNKETKPFSITQTSKEYEHSIKLKVQEVT